MRQRVTEVNPDGIVNLQRALVAFFHQLLHDLQLLGHAQAGIVLNARGRQQSGDCLLREILGTHAKVTAPFVGRRLGMQIHRRKGQLAEPRGDVAIHIHIPAAFARAHGYAEHAVAGFPLLAQRH